MGKAVSSAQPYCFSSLGKDYTRQSRRQVFLLGQNVHVELPVPRVVGIIRGKLFV